MNLARAIVRALLGSRPPLVDGVLEVDGPEQPISIRRDGFGIPHIDAAGDADAWFGLGFCQGQDRTFQLEMLQRVCRGTVSQLVGKRGLPIDRLSRRIGFRRVADATLPLLTPQVRRDLEAFAAGVTAGARHGVSKRPHEFVLLRDAPTGYEAADAVALVVLQSFALAANWDMELARLKVLLDDGAAALQALEAPYAAQLPVTDPPGTAAGPAADRLAADIAIFREITGLGGASNNWAIAGSRTVTGKPLLANDPHLAPLLPPHWYLCHVRTPDWAVAGASFAGAPGIPAGHNGHAAWGVTAGLVDNTDFFVEELGPDRRSVRRGTRFVPCEIREEEIEIRGGKRHHEQVLLTDRGPIVGPALEGEVGALSLQATWLQPAPVQGLLALHRVRSFDELRDAFRSWPVLSLNLAYADAGGTIGWQLVGDAPIRRSGYGTLPLPAWDEATAWREDRVPFDEMPHAADPECGFLATANNKPVQDDEGPFLGADWLDGYRVARITEVLADHDEWDVAACMELQTDQLSLPWRELQGLVLDAIAGVPDLEAARDLLGAWDGDLAADSPAAGLFELFLAEVEQRVVLANAPRARTWALGKGFTPLVPHNLFALGRTAALVRQLVEGHAGKSPPGEIADAMLLTLRRLQLAHGDDPSAWKWGRLRPLTLRHALGEGPLGRVFNEGPLPVGGDANTVAQASFDPADPTSGTTIAIASLRMVVDLDDVERSRFVLPGGQSGNPLSPHYADLLPLWQAGAGVPIAWSGDAVAASTRHTLSLRPRQIP